MTPLEIAEIKLAEAEREVLKTNLSFESVEAAIRRLEFWRREVKRLRESTGAPS